VIVTVASRVDVLPPVDAQCERDDQEDDTKPAGFADVVVHVADRCSE
jgi:hypothetical protein